MLADTLQSVAVTASAREISVGTVRGEVVRLAARGAPRRLSLPGATARVSSLAYVNERDLLVVDEHGNIFGWLGNAREATLLWRAPASTVRSGRMSQMAVAAGARELAVTVDGVVHRLRYRAGRLEEIGVLACDQLAGVGTSALAYSRSGASLILATDKGRMVVWGARSGRCDWSANGPEHPILSIAPLAAGSPVVTTGENLEVRVWSQPPTAQQVRSTVAEWRKVATVRSRRSTLRRRPQPSNGAQRGG